MLSVPASAVYNFYRWNVISCYHWRLNYGAVSVNRRELFTFVNFGYEKRGSLASIPYVFDVITYFDSKKVTRILLYLCI